MPVIFSLITLGVYLFILVPVCIRAKNKSRLQNAADHYLANRSLGLLVLLLTMYATTISGNVMGVSAKAYSMGYTWIIFAGLISAISCSFHLLIPKLRPLSVRYHFITPGDWVRYRFGAKAQVLRVLITLVLMLAVGNYLLAQFKAAGEIIDVMTQKTIPYEFGVVGFALIILTYDSLGGLRAVVWTDAIQGLVMMAGFTSLAIWVIETTNGITNLAHAIAELRPESVPVPGATMQLQWFSLMILGSLAVIIYPQTLQRIFAATEDKTIFQSMAILGIIAAGSSMIFLFSGWAAIPIFGQDASFAADEVIPRLLAHWGNSSILNRISSMMVLLAVLAAIMSTADSVLLSLVSIVRHDLRRVTQREGLSADKWITALVVLIVTFAALYRDITLWRLIELKLELLVQCFPAFVIALHWRKPSAGPFLLGLIGGLIILVTLFFLGIRQISGINAGLIALIGNVVIVGLYWGIQKYVSPKNDATPVAAKLIIEKKPLIND